MPIDSVPALLDELEKSTLLSPEQIAQLRQERSRFRDYKELAKSVVIEHGWMTRYQIVQIIRGNAKDLQFGAYTLLDLIGQGGMGQVFRAVHQTTGRIVALKVIRKERLVNISAIRRFRREVKALSRLSHPNVVLAFDADEWNGNHFIVMEYVDGIDLARWVKDHGPLTPAQSAQCIRDAAQGLEHAHSQGLIHRDVKPSNLLYNSISRSTKILDLGLAFFHKTAAEDTSLTSLTQEGAIVGTVDFISPEQATDSRSVDRRSDIYSLGCTFYYLLTGRVPFPELETLEKLLKHKLDEPTAIEFLRRDVPPELILFIRRMIAKRPDDRFQTASEVAHVLDGWLRATQSGELKAFTPPLPTTVSEDFSKTESSMSGPQDFGKLMDEVTNEQMMPKPIITEPVIRGRIVLFAFLGSMLLIAVAVAVMMLVFPSPPK